MSQTRDLRLFFDKLPPACLIGATKEQLVSRCVANYNAVQNWGKKGNSKALAKAGSGLVAICAWRAAKALAEDAQKEPFQRESGLDPRCFDNSDKELEAAFQAHVPLPVTPRKDRISTTSSPSASTLSALQQLTPQTRLRSVLNRGSLGDNGGITRSLLGEGSTGQSVRFRNIEDLNIEDPETPTRRILRDRNLLSKTQIADPSVDSNIPTRDQTATRTPLSAVSTTQAKRRISEAIEDVTSSPSNYVKSAKKRKRLILDYPGGEPLRVGGIEVFEEWDSKASVEKIHRCFAALQRAIDREEYVHFDSPTLIRF